MPTIAPERILFADDHFLAVHKLSGELSVRGKGKLEKLPLLDFVRKQFPGVRPINRLDFETSGIMLFARTKKALEMSHDLGWKKSYKTIVAGHMNNKKGEISLPLPARSGKGKVEALTKYHVLEQFLHCAFVEAEIASGKFHQIRQHLAMIHNPLVLDQVYGSKKVNQLFTKEFGYRRFFLHASSVSFIHPFTQKEVIIEAPLPKVFEEVLKKLREIS